MGAEPNANPDNARLLRGATRSKSKETLHTKTINEIMFERHSEMSFMSTTCTSEGESLSQYFA